MLMYYLSLTDQQIICIAPHVEIKQIISQAFSQLLTLCTNWITQQLCTSLIIAKWEKRVVKKLNWWIRQIRYITPKWLFLMCICDSQYENIKHSNLADQFMAAGIVWYRGEVFNGRCLKNCLQNSSNRFKNVALNFSTTRFFLNYLILTLSGSFFQDFFCFCNAKCEAILSKGACQRLWKGFPKHF